MRKQFTRRIARREFTQSASSGLALLAIGCIHSGKKGRSSSEEAHLQPHPNYTGPLVPPQEIPWNFMWQQRVTATQGSTTVSFDAVVQKAGPELLVLGLTPFGTRAFSIKQVDCSYKYRQYVPFNLPFSPGSVLIDIHRAYFYGLTNGILQEGVSESSWGQEVILDTVRDRRLHSRKFSHVSSKEGEISIRYEPAGYAPGTPPSMMILENHAYGYTLQVETEVSQRLETAK